MPDEKQIEPTQAEPVVQPENLAVSEKNLSAIKTESQMKIFKLYAGLPVFTVTPTYVGFQGEIVLVDTGTVQSICSYINGSWECATLGSSALTFTQVNQSEHNSSQDLDFEDWDISAAVPVGTKYVDVLLHNTEETAKTAKTRGNGDTTITTVFAIAAGLEMIETCPVDSNRIIEIKSNSTSFGFRIVGYWL